MNARYVWDQAARYVSSFKSKEMIKLITPSLEGYCMVIKAHGVPTYGLLKRANKVLLFRFFPPPLSSFLCFSKKFIDLLISFCRTFRYELEKEMPSDFCLWKNIIQLDTQTNLASC